MLQDGVEPNTHTFVSLFKACGSIQDLQQGRQLHAEADEKGFTSDIFVGSTLVSMYGKCGDIEAAEEVYHGLAVRSNVLCNAMLSAYVEQSQGLKALSLYTQMQQAGVYLDQLTSVLVLQACAILAEEDKNLTLTGISTEVTPIEFTFALHSDAQAKGFTSDMAVGNTLVSVYGKCGAMEEAEYTFGGLSERTVVSWRAMLSAYVEQGQGHNALRLFSQMREEGVVEGQLTFAFALQACGLLAEKEAVKLKFKEIGWALHADANRAGFSQDVFVGSALVSMYSKCGAIIDSEHVFSSLSSRNVVCWNAMLSAYIEHRHGQRALHLYMRMHEEGIKPSRRTFVLAVQACVIFVENGETCAAGQPAKLVSLEIGQALYADIRRKGFASDTFVGSMLVTVYGKCGAIAEAEHVFDALSQCTIVSWTSMLSAYVEEGQGSKALLLYEQMQKQHVTLNDVALICIIQACSLTGSLDLCKHVHFCAVSAGCDAIPFVTATLIHTYGSCSSMLDAHAFFEKFSDHDIVSWNACITGHAEQGNFPASLHMFEKLKLAGVKPDETTFTSILAACSHAGMIFKGLEYFESMSKDYGLTPDIKHFGSILDLLGRTGEFKRVQNMLCSMPMEANSIMWLCLLDACQTHGNLGLAKHVFDHIVDLQPKHVIPV